MQNYMALIKTDVRRQFHQTMRELNALPQHEVLSELVKVQTLTSGNHEYDYSLLYFINERISLADLKEKYPTIFAAAEILHPQQKIDLCNLIMVELQKKGMSVNEKDRHCYRLVCFVREGLHPQLLSCDSLVQRAETDKSCERYAVDLFKMGFTATKASCLLLAKQKFEIEILEHIKARYPEMIEESELFLCALRAQNVTAINWLGDEKEKLKAKKELESILFGGKRTKRQNKKNGNTGGRTGIGCQLADLKDSPRSPRKGTVQPGHELVALAQEVLNRSGM